MTSDHPGAPGPSAGRAAPPLGDAAPDHDDDHRQRWGTAVVWFRRDLRVADHPALAAAAASAVRVIPLFVIDTRLVEGRRASAARTWFLARSLEALDASLRERGGRLVVRRGRPEEVVPALANEVDAELVLVSRDVSGFARRRDRTIATALERDGRRLSARPGLLLVEPESMRTTAGTPFRVFTPFWRALATTPRQPLVEAPARIKLPEPLATADDRWLLVSLAPSEPPVSDLPIPGEAAAQRRLAAWVDDGLVHYGGDRDRLSGDATSRLGADLHLGLLSPRQVEEAVAVRGEMAEPFLRQLAWRDFYHHVLFHRSSGGRHDAGASGARERGGLRTDDAGPMASWKAGMTGIPVVDAGMRQLAATGWMSNRARLVTATFLTRYLGIDHRVGEAHFMRHLIDGDVADNRGGWEWVAGVSPDAPPPFRVIDPVRQGQRFDPDGSWVRRWVPELGSVPSEHVHSPWRMSPSGAAAVGFVLGRTYPAPIVDLDIARRDARRGDAPRTGPSYGGP